MCVSWIRDRRRGARAGKTEEEKESAFEEKKKHAGEIGKEKWGAWEMGR